MITFDPSVGTGSFMSAAMLTEMSLQSADLAAEAGDEALADAFWQLAHITI